MSSTTLLDALYVFLGVSTIAQWLQERDEVLHQLAGIIACTARPQKVLRVSFKEDFEDNQH